MPTHRLPSDPSLEHLKSQARALQRRVRAGDEAALAVVREHHPRLTRLVAGDVASVGLKLADAQLAIARMYGHPSWPRLPAPRTRRRRFRTGSTPRPSATFSR